MGKGKTPRFTRRVHKDVLVIKRGLKKSGIHQETKTDTTGSRIKNKECKILTC